MPRACASCGTPRFPARRQREPARVTYNWKYVMAVSDFSSFPAALHVLHTNDFHGALTDAGAAKLRQAVAELAPGAPYLLLDAGDAIKAGNVGVNPFGEPILERMSEAGYHAMTLGNREFHVWQSALETKINRARFPVLCANVRGRGAAEGKPLPVEPWRVFDLADGGLRVAVLGLTVPMVTERMKAAVAISSFVFDDGIKTAGALVPKLRDAHGADVVIVLSHLGLREDERLARSVPSIDLIVGGHSHVNLPAPQMVDGTPLVQAGVYARHFGHVTLSLAQSDDTGRPRVASVSGVLCSLEEKPRR